MLGIDDWSRRTSTMHADIELIVFFVVTAHLGEVLGIRAVHTLLSGETGPRNLSMAGPTRR
jgi:hypothetical protein